MIHVEFPNGCIDIYKKKLYFTSVHGNLNFLLDKIEIKMDKDKFLICSSETIKQSSHRDICHVAMFDSSWETFDLNQIRYKEHKVLTPNKFILQDKVLRKIQRQFKPFLEKLPKMDKSFINSYKFKENLKNG